MDSRRRGIGKEFKRDRALGIVVRRALVTGGSRGLGLAICQRLFDEGWHVVTASRRLSAELNALITTSGGRVEHYAVDLGNADAVSRLSVHAKLLDGIDAFISNAGVGTEGLLTLTSDEAIQECVQVNLLAPMLLAREVLKGMLTGGGSLVFISSIAARTGFSGLAIYGAAKGGLLAFSRAVAREYGERGIRSNVILPGFLQTEMNRSLSDRDRARITKRVALKRLGGVEDVVGCVSFLLSEQARYITGAEFVVDGGMTA